MRAIRINKLRPVKQGGGTDWDWFLRFVDAGGEPAKQRWQRWSAQRSGPEWEQVKDFLSGFRHDVLHRVDLKDISAVCGVEGYSGRTTSHALGTLRPADGAFSAIADFSTPFAIEYLLHDCLERLGRVPLWNDVKRYLFVEQRERYILPFLTRYGIAGTPAAAAGTPHLNALQWRVGNAYYSWLREVHLLTMLRSVHGLDVRYHALADTEFKADLVAGNAIIALYVPNARFRDGDRGRKRSARAINPDRQVIEVRLDVRKVHGRPWLVEEDCIRSLANLIADAGCPRLSSPGSRAA